MQPIDEFQPSPPDAAQLQSDGNPLQPAADETGHQTVDECPMQPNHAVTPDASDHPVMPDASDYAVMPDPSGHPVMGTNDCTCIYAANGRNMEQGDTESADQSQLQPAADSDRPDQLRSG